jgi:hypothetical protein
VSEQDTEKLKLSKDIGLEWFKVHADQRLRAFNFFLLIAGFCIGGYFTALSISPLAAGTISFLLGAICICFKLLDQRTGELVKQGKQLWAIAWSVWAILKCPIPSKCPMPVRILIRIAKCSTQYSCCSDLCRSWV